MQYIAALDYQHLDNGMFLSSFARALSQQQDVQPIIIHGDSEYTERVIQTGVMRDEARTRSIKDLNHRLVALFADEGVSAVGINGYQRRLVTLQDGQLKLDRDYFNRLPRPTVLLLSSLVYDMDNGQIAPVPLADLAHLMQNTLEDTELFIFSGSDSDELFTKDKRPEQIQWDKLEEHFLQEIIPDEFHQYDQPLRLTTAREFHRIPYLDLTTLIH